MELIRAAEYGDSKEVSRLLSSGVDVNSRTPDSNNITALRWAAKMGHYSICKLLIEKGASMNIKDCMSHSPLHWAAKRGHNDVVKLLLTSGAHPSTRTDDGSTPLHFACYEGHESVVSTLLELGARVNVITYKTKDTPYYIACARGFMNIAAILFKNGAQLKGKDDIICDAAKPQTIKVDRPPKLNEESEKEDGELQTSDNGYEESDFEIEADEKSNAESSGEDTCKYESDAYNTGDEESDCQMKSVFEDEDTKSIEGDDEDVEDITKEKMKDEDIEKKSEVVDRQVKEPKSKELVLVLKKKTEWNVEHEVERSDLREDLFEIDDDTEREEPEAAIEPTCSNKNPGKALSTEEHNLGAVKLEGVEVLKRKTALFMKLSRELEEIKIKRKKVHDEIGALISL